MVRVDFTNRFHQRSDPLLGNRNSRAPSLVQRDPLHEMFSRKWRTQPIGSHPDWRNRFIHQVVAEDSRAFTAFTGDRRPKTGLCFPALFFLQRIVPGWNILFVVATEPGDVEVKAGAFCKCNEFSELFQLSPRRRHWTAHKLAQLEVDANHVGAESLHLLEIAHDSRPISLPIVLDELSALIVIVIKTPWDKGSVRRKLHKS